MSVFPGLGRREETMAGEEIWHWGRARAMTKYSKVGYNDDYILS